MDDVSAAEAPLPDFNVFGWPYTGFVTLLALLIYFYFTFRVGKLRGKFKIDPPETSGPPEFVRAFRIQQNTLEQLMLFLPLLWIAALSSADILAASIGAIWLPARLLYSMNYMKDPKGRLPGFIIGLLVLLVLFGLGAVQLVRSMLVWQ